MGHHEIINTYRINRTRFEESDFIWCKGLGIDLVLSSELATFSLYAPACVYRMVGTVNTVTKKQDAMLHLYFGNDLILLCTDHYG